jgi:hypothetical protein
MENIGSILKFNSLFRFSSETVNFMRIRITWEPKEFGIGIVIFEPKNLKNRYKIGLTVRLLWLLIVIKFRRSLNVI